MLPFHWVPCDGARHASRDTRPAGGYPTGKEVKTLCGREMTADNSQHAWFWGTCTDCNREAHRLAASRQEAQARAQKCLRRK
ncbi:hypothetical protein HUO13_01565 [Saccharopolyspora erythraea]|uniref:zinc finger protein n=1 Tax=Saccharopolyspora erythraea TaxID=1836 RepID=UPI001BAA6E7F|nr:zinc finger protein [Saccharopolyspora erythraea]QUG99656.1 hypothetical protein HUO13_01565 [Saccharopolyspora erythraea]